MPRVVEVKVGTRTVQVEIEDLARRPIVAVVDGEAFEVWPEDDRPAKPGRTPAVPPRRRAGDTP
jgi:hypothetical protein